MKGEKVECPKCGILLSNKSFNMQHHLKQSCKARSGGMEQTQKVADKVGELRDKSGELLSSISLLNSLSFLMIIL
jgi:hypothetical protein